MKTMQIRANRYDNNLLLRIGGVDRIHNGWYTVVYNGVLMDSSTIISAKRNKLGKIKL